MKRYIQLSLVPVLLSSPLPLLAGALDSPASPNDSASAMYTIEDIYNRLSAGADVTKRSAFTEPNSGPTTGTGKTLDDVMNIAPTADNSNGATLSEVANGRTYWSLRSDGTWGPQTGTGTNISGPTCSGTLHGTRWCDNQDGTVTDMTTGLIWLQKADWSGEKPWASDDYDDAHTRAGLLEAGSIGANLSDGSGLNDWRLPTITELAEITNGSEAVRISNMRAFSGVQQFYWSSTNGGFPSIARYVETQNGTTSSAAKTAETFVWPVRSGQ